VGDPVLFETVVIFASVGVFLLVAAALLLKRRTRATATRVAAIRGGSHIPMSTEILWIPKVIGLCCVGVAITLFFFGSVHSFLKNDTRDAIWSLFACAGLTIIFFRQRKIALAMIVLSLLCGWSYPISLVQPTVLGWTVTLSSGAFLLALVIWLTKKYPDMKRGDFKKFFDRDPD
jgi:hypothetical protein